MIDLGEPGTELRQRAQDLLEKALELDDLAQEWEHAGWMPPKGTVLHSGLKDLKEKARLYRVRASGHGGEA